MPKLFPIGKIPIVMELIKKSHTHIVFYTEEKTNVKL